MSKSISNNNLGSENMLFDLLDGFMQICQPGFQNYEKSMQQWTNFKDLISNRPIDYHQVFTFISKMQETDQPSPQKNRQMNSQDQQKDEENESQSSSKQSYQNSSNENIPKNNTKLYHSQRQQNNQATNGNNHKENQQNSSYFNSSQNLSNQINSNNPAGQQVQNTSAQSHSQGRTNNFIKNTQSSYQSNNSGSNSVQNGNNQNQGNHSHQSNQQYPHSQSQNPANNNYFNSTTNNSNGSNQHSNYSSFNNELFAGSSMNMFKTAAGNFQSNTIQNQKKGEQPRSSTRDQFSQGSQQAPNNNNNFNGVSSTNMYNSNATGNNNQNSSRNNYRSSFNQATSQQNNNNNSNNTANIYQNQQSNSKATVNQQNNSSSQVSNFTSSGNVAAMANMHSSKENYSHYNNNGNMEKSSPMNPSKFTNSFKANGNGHSIYNNTSQSSENNHFNSQQSQQSPEKMSSQKGNKNQQNNQQAQQQGNGNHQNNHNGTSNNHTNQFNINNFHGLPNETSTFVKDDNLYSIKSFSEFLKEHTRIQSLGKNTQFTQTSVLELQNNSNSLLKLASIAFFVNLISELPHPESQPNSTCQASKFQLIDIFLKVYNKKLKIQVNSNYIFTSDQLIASFTKNTGLLIQLYLLHGQNTSKLIKAFLYQVQHDPLYLDSLVILIKEIAAEFVEECDYDAIASILMSQMQQQQQNSLSSTSGQLSQMQDNKSAGLSEKERRAKLAQKLRQPSWKEVKPEWLFLLSLSLQRPIELFNLRDNKLEQTLFKSKKMQISEVTANNKINIVTVTQAENKFPIYYLMTMKQTETELYASLKINFKKNELKLNEEVNFPYLIKQITREKEQYQQQQQQQPQQQILNSPTQQIQQNNNNSANLAQLQLSPQSSKQQTSQQNLLQSNSNTNLNKEYSMGHRSSKLGLHLNQLQQQQQPNNLYSSTNTNNLNSHQHNSSVEDQGRKSHSIKTNHISNLNTTGSTSNLNNPSASSPRMHNFMNNLNQLNNQQPTVNQGQQSTQQQQQQQQQQQAPSIEPKQNAPFSKLGNKFSHYENISPKYNLNNLNFQKSTVNSRQHQQSNSLSQDEWNKNLLYAKVKDLIFTLNINSEQLNSLARFSITNTQTGIQSKENIQPKSPLKYKSVLYPLSNNCMQNPNGAIPPNGFSNALNNIMIGQNFQNQQQNSSSTTTINSLSTNTTNNMSNLNNLNNISGTTAIGATSASVQNGNIQLPNNSINNFTSPSTGFNNYINSNPQLFTGQTAFNINSNSKLNTNNLTAVSPSSNFGGNPNPLLLNSTNNNNNNNFLNGLGKSGSGVNNSNSSSLQNFLNSNSYNALQSAGMGTTSMQQQNLNTLNQQVMSSSLNGNSTLTSNSALTQLAGNAPGTVSSKRYPTSQVNPNLVDSQSRDIFNKLSPRRNLNTQY